MAIIDYMVIFRGMYKQHIKYEKRAAAVLLYKNDDDSTTMHSEFHSPLAMFMFLG